MSLFERLGRKAERLKQRAEEARQAKVSRRCEACDEELYSDHDTCPECGSDDVVAGED